VYITGEVVAPQGVYLKEGGMSLYEAIAKIGGPRPQAKTKDIKVYRLKPGSSPESKDRTVISANYDLIRKGQQKDVMLQPYDIIEVDKAKESLAMAIMKVAIGAGKNIIAAGSNSIGYRVLY
jgi:protein involved in polysaccharide export with SLBB domain